MNGECCLNCEKYQKWEEDCVAYREHYHEGFKNPWDDCPHSRSNAPACGRYVGVNAGDSYSNHYKHGQCETVDFVEKVLSCMELTSEQAWAVGSAIKYACRAGYKGDWELDAMKCADFLTRYHTGKWSDVVQD